jgi:YspA, cpYpsA-related SLOG family
VKICIFGSRYYPDPGDVADLVARLPTGTIVITGGAPGVDSWAAHVAEACGLEVQIFRADWKRHGKAAGPIRNAEMVAAADGGFAFWDRRSRGTKDCIEKFSCAEKPCTIHYTVSRRAEKSA